MSRCLAEMQSYLRHCVIFHMQKCNLWLFRVAWMFLLVSLFVTLANGDSYLESHFDFKVMKNCTKLWHWFYLQQWQLGTQSFLVTMTLSVTLPVSYVCDTIDDKDPATLYYVTFPQLVSLTLDIRDTDNIWHYSDLWHGPCWWQWSYLWLPTYVTLLNTLLVTWALFVTIGDKDIICHSKESIWRHKFAVLIILFHSEAKLPWSYDYPLDNHIATNKSSRLPIVRCPCFFALLPFFQISLETFPAKGFKILPTLPTCSRCIQQTPAPLIAARCNGVWPNASRWSIMLPFIAEVKVVQRSMGSNRATSL